MNWVKSLWEALKSSSKIRLEIAIGFSVFLLCESYIKQLPGGKSFFSLLAVPAFLICIIFWVSIILDLFFKIISKIQQKIEDHKYKKYLLSLSGRKLKLVKEIYNSPHYQHYFGQKDTDVMDLAMHRLILCSSRTIIDDEIQADDLNDPPFLYVLYPKALKIIEKHKNKFIYK